MGRWRTFSPSSTNTRVPPVLPIRGLDLHTVLTQLQLRDYRFLDSDSVLSLFVCVCVYVKHVFTQGQKSSPLERKFNYCNLSS